MSLPDYLLDLPAEEAARLIALGLLDRTADAARRLADSTDPMALHDFRVATRRLRSGLEAYRPEIDGSVSRASRRRLRRLARATRRSRDFEVHLHWERAQDAVLTERQRTGLRWHLERLEARRHRADRRLGVLVAGRFARFERRLRRRLEAYRLHIERDPTRRRHEAAAVLGRRLCKFGGDLECRLAAMRTMADDAAARRARIAAKRLRYLLEPIRGEVDGVEPLIVRLRDLQDALGELHDSQTHWVELSGEVESAGREHARRLEGALRDGGERGPEGADAGDDPRPGLLALLERLDDREAEAFARLRADWLAGAADGFFEAVTEVGKRVAHRPSCVAEIERRFLLRRMPASAQAFAFQAIEQGWLPGRRVVERIRLLRRPDVPITYHSSKCATEGRSMAVGDEVDLQLFEQIWPLTSGRRVVKRRHVMSDYGVQWAIDQFLDRDLVLAQAAPPAEGVEVILPEWLQPYVVREVTGEGAYTSRALAR
ncbi:MAG: CHAD domain-containing protein [Gemmatimonadota bacterium]|nr:CHAD domain-containing protein [Gemmatimonadota bacterium]